MNVVGSVPGDPAAPLLHRFRSRSAEHVLVVPYSRVFDLSLRDARALDRGDNRITALYEALAERELGEEPLDMVVAPQPQAISLNVSSSCNLSCSYCYAARGSFDGAQTDPMQWEAARAAIDTLLRDADPKHPVTIGFLGGEPFVNRALVHRAVRYGAEQGQERDLDVGFSVTTNGTLLSPADLALLRTYRFAVTISIDGGRDVQESQRPSAGRRANRSFDALQKCVTPLLEEPGRAKIAARATVTRPGFDLKNRFDDILALGFSEVGFSPLRAGKDSSGALRSEDWPLYLEAMTNLAKGELDRLRAGSSIRLTNLAVALKQIARGASSPYPCGAGGGYFSVGSDGRWYACHRAIGSPDFDMGDSTGLDETRRQAFLKARHVHAQEACGRCWARYLCSGSCHQEASARSESACGFVRGWLEFCLSAYCEISDRTFAATQCGQMEQVA
jgi:uncharacterized protein